MIAPLRPALFIDRDGVLIENRDSYVRSWSDVAFLPGILESMAQVATLPFLVVIVTNQSAVGRGHITVDEAASINQRVIATIEQAGGRIDGAYICPHAPEDACACRKPLPGMLLQAADDLAIDLGRSIMVGDALTDMMAGQAAGVGQSILVRTGRGIGQAQLPAAADLPAFRIVDSLLDILALLEAVTDDR